MELVAEQREKLKRVFQQHDEKARKAFKQNEWNHYRIEAIGTSKLTNDVHRETIPKLSGLYIFVRYNMPIKVITCPIAVPPTSKPILPNTLFFNKIKYQF